MKITDLFSITTLKAMHGKRVDLLDADGTILLRVDDKTTDSAINALWESVRHVFRNSAPDDWTPVVIEYRGYRKMIYRDTDGWQVNFLETPAGPDGTFYRSQVRVCTLGAYDTRKRAENSARRDLAQIGWKAGETTSDVILPDDAIGQDEFRQWVKYQNLWIQAQAQGLTGRAADDYVWANRF